MVCIEVIIPEYIYIYIYKTNVIKFNFARVLGDSFQSLYQGKEIKEVINIKFFDLRLDKHVEWKTCVEQIIPKMNSTMKLDLSFIVII
jgi:hypothetical protein